MTATVELKRKIAEFFRSNGLAVDRIVIYQDFINCCYYVAVFASETDVDARQIVKVRRMLKPINFTISSFRGKSEQCKLLFCLTLSFNVVRGLL